MYSFPGAPIAKGHKLGRLQQQKFILGFGGYRPKSQVSAGRPPPELARKSVQASRLAPGGGWRPMAGGAGATPTSAHLHGGGGSATGPPALLQHVVTGDIREDPASNEATCRGAGGWGSASFWSTCLLRSSKFNPSLVFYLLFQSLQVYRNIIDVFTYRLCILGLSN